MIVQFYLITATPTNVAMNQTVTSNAPLEVPLEAPLEIPLVENDRLEADAEVKVKANENAHLEAEAEAEEKENLEINTEQKAPTISEANKGIVNTNQTTVAVADTTINGLVVEDLGMYKRYS